jgi:Flp pilus assembly protein TadG
VRLNVTSRLRQARLARRRGTEGERGAALVEFAFIAPILMVLVLGIVEFGIAWNEKSQAEAAVRSGGRIASASSRSDTLTKNAAAAVSSALQALPSSEPQYVLVYRIPAGADDSPPNGGASCSANCNKFNWVSGALDIDHPTGPGWPAANQVNNCSTSITSPSQFDQVGVYVKVNHPLTLLPGFIPGMASSVTLAPHSVFRLEPSNSTECG